MDLIGSLLLFSKTLFPSLHFSWSNSFNSVYRLLPILFTETFPRLSLCLKRVAILIPQTTSLKLQYPDCFKFLNLLSIGWFVNICHFTIFCPTSNMACVKVALQVFLTESWSFFFKDFGETDAVALTYQKL